MNKYFIKKILSSNPRNEEDLPEESHKQPVSKLSSSQPSTPAPSPSQPPVQTIKKPQTQQRTTPHMAPTKTNNKAGLVDLMMLQEPELEDTKF